MVHPLQEGTKLVARYQALGYTQIEVARGAGVDRNSLNDYAFRRMSISPRNLARLAAFLQCEPEALLDDP